MKKQLTFDVYLRDALGGVPDYDVKEKGGRHVAWFGEKFPRPLTTEQRAQKYAQHLTAEHAGGRVAQGSCQKGHACDFARINDLVRVDRALVILCPEHTVVVDGARKPRAAA